MCSGAAKPLLFTRGRSEINCKAARSARDRCPPFFILKPRRTFGLCLSVCFRFATRSLENSC
jgi:hypothetical protein